MGREQRRREKLALYEEAGIDPFGHKFDVDSSTVELKEKFASLLPQYERNLREV